MQLLRVKKDKHIFFQDRKMRDPHLACPDGKNVSNLSPKSSKNKLQDGTHQPGTKVHHFQHVEK